MNKTLEEKLITKLKILRKQLLLEGKTEFKGKSNIDKIDRVMSDILSENKKIRDVALQDIIALTHWRNWECRKDIYVGTFNWSTWDDYLLQIQNIAKKLTKKLNKKIQ